ncbi:MAG: choice-of-anchor D domain-containing protein [Terriglobia bacterium]
MALSVILAAAWQVACGGGGSTGAAITPPAPVASIAPGSLAFGNQTINTTSATQTVTLTNTGNAALSIAGITVIGTNAGDFAQTNACGSSVAAGANCTITVTFTSTATGARAGTLIVTDNNNGTAGSTQTVSLSGTGTSVPAPVVSLSVLSLAFGNQTVNTNSTAQTVTLTNTGNAALSIAGITVTGTNASDFTQSNTCGSSVAAAANCTISVTFTPVASGSRTASVSITDNASGSPQTASLSGTGTAALVSLSATSLAFGTQPVGTPSTAQTLTLSNTGSTALSITSVALTGTNASDFAQTNTCGSSVAAAANCTISVTFTPVASGSRTASVSITDNASGSPQTASLSGTGTAALVSVSPTSLAFGNQPVEMTSTAQAVTLSNTGNAALSITSLALTGTNASDFEQSNTCGSSLAAGANCTIAVMFTPVASGSRTASMSITDNASGSPQTVGLSGTGTAAVASLSPTSLAFGNQAIDMTSATQTVTLSNTGNAALSITSLALTGTNASDFDESNTCGSSLAAGANCTIAVWFMPSVAGPEAASLSIADNSSGSPQTVGLSGAGTHDVILTWTASTTSGVVGYDVYRGTTSGGPYPTQLNSTPINGTTYTDETVQAGQTYYYVVTAVASDGIKSAYSNQVSATVP